MKDNLVELNANLFMQLRRLNEDGLKGDELMEEVKRTESLTSVATKIIESGTLSLKAALMVANSLAEVNMPSMLESTSKERKLIS